jgi:hypothetical protein
MEVVCPSCKTAARSAHSIVDKDPHKIPRVTEFWMDREWRWGDRRNNWSDDDESPGCVAWKNAHSVPVLKWNNAYDFWKCCSANKGSCSNWHQQQLLGDWRSDRSWVVPLRSRYERSNRRAGSCSNWDELQPLGYGRSNRSWNAPLGSGYRRARYWRRKQTLVVEMGPSSSTKCRKPDAGTAWDPDYPWE